MRKIILLGAATFFVFAVTGCGLKGPLYYPTAHNGVACSADLQCRQGIDAVLEDVT